MATRLTLSLALLMGLVAGDAHAERSHRPRNGALANEVSQEAKARSIAVSEVLDSTLDTATVTGELLQIVGQLVVDRATEAGLDVLSSRIKDALACGDGTTYPRTCKVLRDVRIEDLLASPRVLLDAAVTDLASIWRTKLGAKMAASTPLKYAVGVSMGLGGVLALWSGGQQSTAASAIMERLKQQLVTVVQATSCPGDATRSPFDLESTRAVWGVAMCLADTSKNSARARLDACDLSTLKECVVQDPQQTESLVQVANELKAALTSTVPLDVAEGVLVFITRGVAARIRDDSASDATCFKKDDQERAKANNLCAALVEDFGQVTVGILRQDWSRFVAGAVAALNDYGNALGNSRIAGTKFFQLLAAIGQYAHTYRATDVEGSNTEAVGKARREIVASLVKQMTNRAERSGWIFSLGGSFGVAPAYRRELGGSTRGYSLLALPLGIGLQSYPKSADDAFGFHAQLGLLDLGQYITFEDNHETTVGTPDPKASFAVSATIGVWGLSRNVPMFVGAHAGLAPFVLESGKPELYVGAMVGAYVPLLDF